MTVRINHTWLRNNVNPKANDPIADHALDYLNTWKGTFRGTQVVQKTARLAAEIGKNAYDCSTLKMLDKNLGIGLGAMGFASFPSAAASAVTSLSNVWVDDGAAFSRKAAKAVKDTADFISSGGLLLTFVKKNPIANAVASAADLIADSTDIQMAVSDYWSASSLEVEARDPEVKKALAHTKNSNFYRLLKNVCSVAGAILGLAYFAVSIPFVAMIVLSLAGTLFGIKKDMIDATAAYKVIKFDRPVRV